MLKRVLRLVLYSTAGAMVGGWAGLILGPVLTPTVGGNWMWWPPAMALVSSGLGAFLAITEKPNPPSYKGRRSPRPPHR